jgi:DNA-binding CsgD family transcriptional regulator
MPRLSASDYRMVLDVLGEAAAVEDAIPFPEPVLDALRRLVACDVVAYHEELSPGKRQIVFTGEPRGAMTQEIRDAAARYWHQDPMTPVDGARKYSDFFSRREYHRLELYQEAARPLEIEYMMRLWLDPAGAGGARLEFDRAGPDFGERDRAVLDLLLPHLKQFRRRAASRRRVSAEAASGADRLTRREREIVHRVAEGRTNAEVASLLRISPETVRKHLENAYDKLGVHTRTGAVAALFELEVEIA